MRHHRLPKPYAAATSSGIMYDIDVATPDTTRVAPLTFWEDGSMLIGNPRVTLDSVVHEFAGGATAEQIQEDFPTLSLREIYGAISYYLEHEDQVRREFEDRPRVDALRRRILKRYARLKAKS